MPLNASLWSSLQKTYGADKARDVYYGMEQNSKEGKNPSFAKGLKTAMAEGHVIGLSPQSGVKTPAASPEKKMAYEGFAALKGKLAKRGGVSNPGALAAFIGRKKYGKAKFQAAAAKGKKLGKKKS